MLPGHQQENGVVLTSGGKLSCKHIAQMVGPNNAADITTSVEKVLKLCETAMSATVAIPAIGTGETTIIQKQQMYQMNVKYSFKNCFPRERWYWSK